jgi:uncharacterized membrane protein
MTEILLTWFNGIPGEVVVFLLAMAPIVELRAALPLGLTVYQLGIPLSWLLVVVGNMIPAFFIIYGWHWLVEHIAKVWPWFGGLMNKWYEKVQGQWDEKIEKYGPWALVLFVAIPLPGSGVWSGALAAWIFQLNKKRALISIFFGVLLSALVVTIITLGGVSLFT